MSSENVDARHLRRMEQTIQDFYAKRLPIAQLIGRLEGLLNALEDASSDWRNDFLGEWGKLEELYAVSLDRRNPSLIDENETQIRYTLTNILRMIEAKNSADAKGIDE